MESAAEQLWQETRHLFEEDDGSLPDLRIDELSEDGVQAVFDALLPLSDLEDPLGGKTASLDGLDKPISSIPDVGKKAARGEVMPVHFVIEGVRMNGTFLPALGVFLEPGASVAFDYRMGSDWDARSVSAFVSLLDYLRGAAGEGALASLPDGGRAGQEDPAFPEAANRYLRSVKT